MGVDPGTLILPINWCKHLMTRWAGFFLCLWSCKTEKEGPTFWIHVIWSTWATFLVFVHFPPIPLLCCLYIQVCVYVYILILLFFFFQATGIIKDPAISNWRQSTSALIGRNSSVMSENWRGSITSHAP